MTSTGKVAVAEFVALPPELMLFCGLALGHRDEAAPINGLRTDRAELREQVIWHGVGECRNS